VPPSFVLVHGAWHDARAWDQLRPVLDRRTVVIAQAAAARLRPQARAPHDEPCPLVRFPDVPTSYIVMREDRMVRSASRRRRSACCSGASLRPADTLPHYPMVLHRGGFPDGS
jgi:hypothetical protein